MHNYAPTYILPHSMISFFRCGRFVLPCHHFSQSQPNRKQCHHFELQSRNMMILSTKTVCFYACHLSGYFIIIFIWIGKSNGMPTQIRMTTAVVSWVFARSNFNALIQSIILHMNIRVMKAKEYQRYHQNSCANENEYAATNTPQTDYKWRKSRGKYKYKPYVWLRCNRETRLLGLRWENIPQTFARFHHQHQQRCVALIVISVVHCNSTSAERTRSNTNMCASIAYIFVILMCISTPRTFGAWAQSYCFFI